MPENTHFNPRQYIHELATHIHPVVDRHIQCSLEDVSFAIKFVVFRFNYSEIKNIPDQRRQVMGSIFKAANKLNEYKNSGELTVDTQNKNHLLVSELVREIELRTRDQNTVVEALYDPYLVIKHECDFVGFIADKLLSDAGLTPPIDTIHRALDMFIYNNQANPFVTDIHQMIYSTIKAARDIINGLEVEGRDPSMLNSFIHNWDKLENNIYFQNLVAIIP